MKATSTTLILAASMIFFGCGDDDSNPGGAAGSGASAGSGGTAGSGGMAQAREVAVTPVVGTLSPYQDMVPDADGSDLFPPNSVEAHWYQWDGKYVVLYRGYDATDMTGICPGNSIQVGQAFGNISNSPYPSSASAACEGAALVTETGAGSFGCGTLLYYVTQVPTNIDGNLWGTMELSVPGGFVGQTTFGTATDLANTPEFEPGLDAYDLPASTVDAGGVVSCPP